MRTRSAVTLKGRHGIPVDYIKPNDRHLHQMAKALPGDHKGSMNRLVHALWGMPWRRASNSFIPTHATSGFRNMMDATLS